jgi:pyrroline-5-carboxylate reductase
MMRTGFIGGGNMAEAMIKGMTARGMKDIIVSDRSEERLKHLSKTYGVETTASNMEVVQSARLIVLAVKPQNMDDVLGELGGAISEDRTVMSIAAGITLDYLASRIKSNKIIRVMPNTPALVGEGMSVMSLCECFSDEGLNAARDVLMSIGRVITLPEKYMDAVTAVSGSGPGFIALFVEHMIKAGVGMGLSEEDSSTLVVQTIVGTARLLDTGIPPSRLREMVTSPGGTTAAGIEVFRQRNLQETVIAALEAARDRSMELGQGRK